MTHEQQRTEDEIKRERRKGSSSYCKEYYIFIIIIIIYFFFVCLAIGERRKLLVKWSLLILPNHAKDRLPTAHFIGLCWQNCTDSILSLLYTYTIYKLQLRPYMCKFIAYFVLLSLTLTRKAKKNYLGAGTLLPGWKIKQHSFGQSVLWHTLENL